MGPRPASEPVRLGLDTPQIARICSGSGFKSVQYSNFHPSWNLKYLFPVIISKMLHLLYCRHKCGKDIMVRIRMRHIVMKHQHTYFLFPLICS